MSCPDCDGSFTVSALAGRLYFVGWIGHSYRLADALAAKEERLENRLWTVVTAVEELVALLKDLHARGGSLFARAEYGRRNEALRVLTDELRRLIETSVPIDLGVVDADAAPESAES